MSLGPRPQGRQQLLFPVGLKDGFLPGSFNLPYSTHGSPLGKEESFLKVVFSLTDGINSDNAPYKLAGDSSCVRLLQVMLQDLWSSPTHPALQTRASKGNPPAPHAPVGRRHPAPILSWG